MSDYDHERYNRAIAKQGFVSAGTAIRYFFEVMHAEVNYYLFDIGGQIVCVGARDLERGRQKAIKLGRLLELADSPVLMRRLDSSSIDLTGAW